MVLNVEHSHIIRHMQFRKHTAYYAYVTISFKLLKPTGHVMHQQFNIQQLYVLPTQYLCVLYLSENKQRLVPLTASTDLVFITEMKSVYCAVRTGSLNKAVCASYLKGQSNIFRRITIAFTGITE